MKELLPFSRTFNIFQVYQYLNLIIFHKYLMQHSLKLGGNNYHFKWVKVPRIPTIIERSAFPLRIYHQKVCMGNSSNILHSLKLCISSYYHIIFRILLKKFDQTNFWWSYCPLWQNFFFIKVQLLLHFK